MLDEPEYSYRAGYKFTVGRQVLLISFITYIFYLTSRSISGYLFSICSQNFTVISYFLHEFYVFVQSVLLLRKGFAVDSTVLVPVMRATCTVHRSSLIYLYCKLKA